MAKNLIKRLQRKQKLQEADDEARRLVEERMKEYCTKADVSILYTLHEVFGFGKTRCERFYKSWIKTHSAMADSFQSGGDDSHYWVMQERLKSIGVDVEALQKEVEDE